MRIFFTTPAQARHQPALEQERENEQLRSLAES
jgi:hypothetical protein